MKNAFISSQRFSLCFLLMRGVGASASCWNRKRHSFILPAAASFCKLGRKPCKDEGYDPSLQSVPVVVFCKPHHFIYIEGAVE